MLKKLSIAVAAAFAVTASAGEWHTGTNNLCTDCHTMHFSQAHTWSGTGTVATTPAGNGDWVGTTGPNAFLLKLPANALCASCHDGQTFAPDVIGANTNAAAVTQGRSAGALNGFGTAAAEGYDAWEGHTLDQAGTPPGFNPALLVSALSTMTYEATDILECLGCHTQHGIAGVYRNLGPRSLGTGATGGLPSYVISTTNNTSRDVWVNIASYTAGSGSAATMAPFYDQANIRYNRIDKTLGAQKTSNGIDSVCATCHANFHGGGGDVNIGADASADPAGFIRHPTSQEELNDGAHGTSNLARYVAAANKTKVYTTDYVGYSDASPGCVSCHKAHGNQNPFGLYFINRTATGTPNEQGLLPAGTTTPAYMLGYQSLCGNCHGQGR